jgi:hypothetical protein
MYVFRTVFVHCMYRACSKMSLYIQASSYSEQFESSTYFVHQYTRLKASQQHIPNKSKHSFQFSTITFSVLHPCPLQEGPLAAAGGSAGRASAPAALAALASAAARPRRPRWPPLQRGRRGRGCSSAARPCCWTEGASEGLPQQSWQSIVHRWICRGQGCDVVMLTLQRR